MEGRSDKVSFEATGYRDVYYCSILNEPMIIEYHHDEATGERYPFCVNCNWLDTKATLQPNNNLPGLQYSQPTEDFLGLHEYICTIHKHAITGSL